MPRREQTLGDGALDAELVQFDAIGGQLGQVLATAREDEHEQREQHGDAGGVDEEDELLIQYGVELRLWDGPRQPIAEEVIVDGGILLLGDSQHLAVVDFHLAEARDALVRELERADDGPKVRRVELVEAVGDAHQLQLRHHHHLTLGRLDGCRCSGKTTTLGEGVGLRCGRRCLQVGRPRIGDGKPLVELNAVDQLHDEVLDLCASLQHHTATRDVGDARLRQRAVGEAPAKLVDGLLVQPHRVLQRRKLQVPHQEFGLGVTLCRLTDNTPHHRPKGLTQVLVHLIELVRA